MYTNEMHLVKKGFSNGKPTYRVSFLINLRPLGVKMLGRGFNKRDMRTL